MNHSFHTSTFQFFDSKRISTFFWGVFFPLLLLLLHRYEQAHVRAEELETDLEAARTEAAEAALQVHPRWVIAVRRRDKF